MNKVSLEVEKKWAKIKKVLKKMRKRVRKKKSQKKLVVLSLRHRAMLIGNYFLSLIQNLNLKHRFFT